MRTLVGMIIGFVIGYVYKDSIKENIVDPFRRGLEEGGKSTEPRKPGHGGPQAASASD